QERRPPLDDEPEQHERHDGKIDAPALDEAQSAGLGFGTRGWCGLRHGNVPPWTNTGPAANQAGRMPDCSRTGRGKRVVKDEMKAWPVQAACISIGQNEAALKTNCLRKGKCRPLTRSRATSR